MTKKIDPSWFDLNNYKSLMHFDLAQWINVLGFRMRLNYLLKEKKGDYSEPLAKSIKANGINGLKGKKENSPAIK